jgi:hypothetical protein
MALKGRKGRPKKQMRTFGVITEPGPGFDLGPASLTDANLIELAMRATGVDPTAPNAREQLRRALTKLNRPPRRGRPSEELKLVAEIAAAGALEDFAPVAAQKVAEYRGWRADDLEGLTQKIRRMRRVKMAHHRTRKRRVRGGRKSR